MADHAIVAVQVAIVVILFVLYSMATYPALKKVSLFLPPATVMVMVGIVLGAVLEAAGEIQEVFEFDEKIFFNLLLPPIIFHAGLTLPKETFFRNLGSILTFAFLGTVVASFLLGGLIKAAGSGLGVDVSFVNAMVLGSLLAAVDPVSTISVFKSAGAPVTLYTLVMGESVLNDAVSIVINREFVKLAEDEDKALGPSMGKALGLIIGVTIGSVALGVVFGLASALVHKHSKLSEKHHHHVELAVFFSVAYLSFVVAEEVHLSGIMSSLFCAIVMDHYSKWSLSEETKHAQHAMFEMLAEVAESFVFLYLGLATFTFGSHSFKVGFSFCVFLFCVLARFVSVFPLAAALNVGRKRPIPLKHQGVMFLSGLRGAVAFALALEVPRKLGDLRDIFITTTLVQVFITILLFGGATYPLLNYFRLTHSAAEIERRRSTVAAARGTGQNSVAKTQHWFVAADRDYFRRWFRTADTAAVADEDADQLAPEIELDTVPPGQLHDSALNLGTSSSALH